MCVRGQADAARLMLAIQGLAKALGELLVTAWASELVSGAAWAG